MELAQEVFHVFSASTIPVLNRLYRTCVPKISEVPMISVVDHVLKVCPKAPAPESWESKGTMPLPQGSKEG